MGNIPADTICAVATPPGRGGVSIVRVSGPMSSDMAQQVIGYLPAPRQACYGPFHGRDAEVIDIGIGLFFQGPDSFTGEDIIEFQAHGGPVIVDLLLELLLSYGCRLARPGEFSERAFLNNKMDLAQAEAVADLIDCHSKEASRSALRSLQGEFSAQIHSLVEDITRLRVFVEAAIDFPEEEIDLISEGAVDEKLHAIESRLNQILARAKQGSILKEGLRVVIAGLPNAGKSSLLNRLSGQDSAIVTDIPGTTRDTLREQIVVHGIPLHVVDTAGLRTSDDPVEQEGVRRAWLEIEQADLVLLIDDMSRPGSSDELLVSLQEKTGDSSKLVVISNKVDLSEESPGLTEEESGLVRIRLSAKQDLGLELLRNHLRDRAGIDTGLEGGFLARRRHLDALNRAAAHLDDARSQIESSRAGELIAEDLKLAQNALGEITGELTPDELLGEIFSSFCIGK